ncbi:helix-turn-helix transcriptional regulator [Streptomyces sp. 549]|uniref:telomere-associated protein Tap n=1 Tax=Streptomyces sp. 549 TaxID=3049076 RepID=UPI0024C225DB|nr:helix-turn-helix transcriptional regulator [Streptomyces sp. 549]MDK1475851.1 helix-turn-helix transcriptional regulator [Streptomyces sp. 549]
MSERIEAINALIASRPVLPPPAERERLRRAHGLTQDQVAEALGVRRATLVNWEAGRTDPRPPQRDAYAHLLTELAKRYPLDDADAARAFASTPAPAPAPVHPPPAATEPARSAEPVSGAERPPAVDPPLAAEPVGPTRHGSGATDGAPPPPAPFDGAAKKRRVTRPTPQRAESTADHSPDAEFAHGPLGVLDGEGLLHCVDGLLLECPAVTVAALAAWTLAEARLGAHRLHPSGWDADPLVVLTAEAAERLGLPDRLEDRRELRLPPDHQVIQQLVEGEWQLTRRGFGPWARVHRPAQHGRRQCVQFAVLPWGALDARSWSAADRLPPAQLAHVLGTYARRVLTPRGSTAVSGLEAMTALRPPTRAVRDTATGRWVSGPVPGSLTEAVDPAPVEAPAEHPLVVASYPRSHQRTPAEMLDEEAYDWIRDPQLLTDAECARSYAVGIDVNTAFLAAANRLVVGLGPPTHVRRPEFDKKTPGSWLVDLSGITLDPRLPSPFTPHGEPPTGPAWYATPTVAYARELVDRYGLDCPVTPVEAWLRTESGPYLDPWYKHLADAYKATMADLGVVTGMSAPDFLAAMEKHKEADPATAAVLSAIKSTVKGGIGKLRERPQGAGYRYGERWPALERPTWRPDIRAAVIAAARVNMHRKVLATALATQSAPAPSGSLVLGEDAMLPIAMLSDCAVYLSPGPSPLDVLPYTPDGKPAAGCFRLGVSPGMVKHEGTQDMLWAVRMLDEGHNPARHIKGTDAANDGE